MVRAALQPLAWVRSAVMLAVAVGLVLPAPARCAGCAAGGKVCALCQVSGGDKTTANRSCCQQDVTAEASVALSAVDCRHIQARTCGCRVSPVDRTNAPAERHLTVPNFLAALPATLPLVDDAAGSVFAAITAFGDLPPPVPHRVLHCSWII